MLDKCGVNFSQISLLVKKQAVKISQTYPVKNKFPHHDPIPVLLLVFLCHKNDTFVTESMTIIIYPIYD